MSYSSRNMGFLGLGALTSADVQKLMTRSRSQDQARSSPTANVVLFPSDPAYRFMTSYQESVVDPSRNVALAFRSWDVWVKPETDEWLRTLSCTWTAWTSDLTARNTAPTNWRDAWAYVDLATLPTEDQQAAKRALGFLGMGAWLKEPAVFWTDAEGYVIYDTAAWRMDRKVKLASGPNAGRTDTLALVESMDAGTGPVVRQLTVTEGPVPERVITHLKASAGIGVVEKVEYTYAPRPEVKPIFFTDGQFKDASGNVVPTSEIPKIFGSPTVSPTVVKAVQGTSAAIVDIYGGGPGISVVSPDVGKTPMTTVRLPSEAVPGQVEIATPGGAAAAGPSAASGGKNLLWLVAAGAAFYFLGKRRRSA